MKLTQSICALQLEDEPGSWQAPASKTAPSTTTTLGTIDMTERSAAGPRNAQGQGRFEARRRLGGRPCLWARDVLARILIEGLLTARGAKVIGLAFLKRAKFRMSWVNAHSAYRIDR